MRPRRSRRGTSPATSVQVMSRCMRFMTVVGSGDLLEQELRTVVGRQQRVALDPPDHGVVESSGPELAQRRRVQAVGHDPDRRRDSTVSATMPATRAPTAKPLSRQRREIPTDDTAPPPLAHVRGEARGGGRHGPNRSGLTAPAPSAGRRRRRSRAATRRRRRLTRPAPREAARAKATRASSCRVRSTELMPSL